MLKLCVRAAEQADFHQIAPYRENGDLFVSHLQTHGGFDAGPQMI